MAEKNQTPAPKISGMTDDKNDGQRKELVVDHLESGYDKGISPELRDEGPLTAKTTQQQQEERMKNSQGATKSLEIPSGNEGEALKKHNR